LAGWLLGWLKEGEKAHKKKHSPPIYHHFGFRSFSHGFLLMPSMSLRYVSFEYG